jgi:hypothetical protein
MAFALIVENLHRFKPAALGRVVQFTEITQCSLTRPSGSANSFHQRPVGVCLRLSCAHAPAKHSQASLPRNHCCDKRVGLHYIGFPQKPAMRVNDLARPNPQNLALAEVR